ncbi:MAG: helix-turn-helix domain-containing protein [Terricaulis sp.]
MGRKGGRQKSMSEDDVAAARMLLASPDIASDAVAERMNVSPATLYRYFPGGRQGLEVRPFLTQV